jgi:hypothetical protein
MYLSCWSNGHRQKEGLKKLRKKRGDAVTDSDSDDGDW